MCSSSNVKLLYLRAQNPPSPFQKNPHLHSTRRLQLNVLNPSGSCYKNVQFVADNWLLCSLDSGFWVLGTRFSDPGPWMWMRMWHWLFGMGSSPWLVIKLSSKIDKSRKGCANHYCYYYDYYKLVQLLQPLIGELWMHGEKITKSQFKILCCNLFRT